MKNAKYYSKALALFFLKPFVVALLFALDSLWLLFRAPSLTLASNTVNTTWDQIVGEHKIAGPGILPTSAIPAGEASRWLVYTLDASTHKLNVCGVHNKPYCVVDNQGVATTEYAVPLLLGAGVHTLKARAAGSITIGQDIYAAASGQVSVCPTAAGLYWRIGRSMTTVTVADDLIEFIPCSPQAVVVTGAPTIGAAVATTAATNSSPYGYAQAQADAIVARVNQLLVDVAAIQAALLKADADAFTQPSLILAGTVVAG